MNKNDKLSAQKTREETALQKYTMIASLLNEQLDPSAAYELRLKLAEQYDVSERTLRCYVNANEDTEYAVIFEDEANNIMQAWLLIGFYH